MIDGKTFWQWLVTPIVTVGGSQIAALQIVALIAVIVGAWWVAARVESAIRRFGSHHSSSAGSIFAWARVVRYLIWVLGHADRAERHRHQPVELRAGRRRRRRGHRLRPPEHLQQLLFRHHPAAGEVAEGRRLRRPAVGHPRPRARDRTALHAHHDQRRRRRDRAEHRVHQRPCRQLDVQQRVPPHARAVRRRIRQRQVDREGGCAACRASGRRDGRGSGASDRRVAGRHGRLVAEFRARRLVGLAATAKPANTEAAYLWALHDELVAAKLEIPFAQRDINLRSGELRVRVVPNEAEAAAPSGRST